ncbi:MAG: branched-chain amino acid ABC transporter permease [Acidimicrobiia bacterium]|nr:branched-chain amino acid ABC transporter permease [Acidimicrobiia bacterium]
MGACGHEADLAEIHETRVAEVHVESDGRQGVHHHLGADHGREGAFEDESPVHGSADPLLLAENALGSQQQRAIREDEDAARALGKNAYFYKMQSLMLGGMIGGVAGMLQVIQKASVQADTFNPVITFTIWTILIVGGAGRVWSPIVGASIYWTLIVFIENTLRQLPEGTRLSLERTIELSDFNIAMLRFILVGSGLLLLARFRPQGIFGSREEMALDRR